MPKSTKPPHSSSYGPSFIEKIKAMRSLTRMLGKLNICPEFKHRNEMYFDKKKWTAANGLLWRPQATDSPWDYGIGLKYAKDMVQGYLDRERAAAATTLGSVGVVEGKTSTVKPIGKVKL